MIHFDERSIGESNTGGDQSYRLLVVHGHLFDESTGLLIMDTSGALIRNWQTTAVNSLCTTKNGNILGLNQGDAYFIVFSPEGEMLAKLGKLGQGDGEFRSVFGVTVNSSNSLIIIDNWGWKVNMMTIPPLL